MSTANKLSYLNDTKSLLRTSLNKFGSSILSTDTFRSYDTKLNEIYDKLPKVTQSGAGFTLSNVQNGQVDDFKMIGVDLEQETVETITISDWVQGFIDENTGNFSSVNYDITTNNFIPIFPNILYNISRTIYTSFMRFRFYDENKTYLGSQQYIDVTTNKEDNRMLEGVTSMQLTINDNRVKYMKICDHSNDLSTVYTITTNATPSPIYPQEIKVVEGRQVITDKGKNLFTLDNFLTRVGQPTTTGNNQEFTISGEGSYNANIYKIGKIKDYIGKTLTFKAGFVSTSIQVNTAYSFISCDSDGNNRVELSRLTLNDNNLTGTYTIPSSLDENLTLAIRLYGTSSTGGYTTYTNTQIEESSTATDYEPYYNPVSYNIDLDLENIYLAKIPDTNYKNRIYKDNGNWYFEKNVEKVILDGSETITIQNIGTDNWYYQLSVNCYKTEQLKQMSSHYNNLGIYNSNTYQGIMMLTEGNFIRIRYGEEDTISNFKAWLSNNNVTLWYPLINSITTQITNTTLISQLEAISVYTGTNIITLSSDNNMTPQIEITRLKELERLT